MRFKIEDVVDNTPSVTAVRLTGGPLSEDVNLGFYNTGTEYRVEFPMMLPSLESGDYRLYVTAEDDFGNSRTVSAVFDYGPARFGLLPENGDIISLPRINVPTRLRNNNWPLTTDPAIMTDAGGLPVLGQRNLTITLSDDAQGPLVVGSITVNPGATEVYPNYDFTANQSALALPLHFADPEAMTEGRFGTLIVQIDNPDAPVFIEDIEAWDPSPSIEVTQAAPSFAKQVETASFRLRNGGTQKCETLVAMVAGDTYRNLRFSENVAICALEWVALPPDLEAMRLDRSRVGGIIRSFDDSVDLSYQPGLLIKQAGNFVFYPVGAVVAHQVELYDPDPPIITVGPTSAGAGQLDWLPTGSFPTSVGQYVAGYANGRADFKRLGMQITNLDTGMVVLDNTYSSSFARGAIETNIADFEGEENFRVDVRYTNYPAIQSTATVRFVALPKEPVIQLARPQAPNNMSDTVVQGRFGKVNRNEFTFNQATMGNWVVRIYKQEAGAGGASTRTQLGADVTHIAANGDFTVNLGTLEAGVYAIIATATYQSASPDIEGRVEGLPAVIKVYNGDPIVFSLVTNRPTGRPPTTATVKVSMEDRKRAGDVGRIEWERSTDGTTFEPIVRHARYDRSFGYGERHATAGEFWYRATTVNRYSGATHRSDPIKIHIYDIPKFTLSGYNYTFTNYPVEWSVVPEEAGRPSIYKWTVRPGSYRAEPVEYVGRTQTFDASIRGSWYITVHARYRDAPDVPGSWRKVSGLLKVAPPYMSRPRIVGPTYVEDSQTYEYRAQTYAVTRGNADPNIRVVGRWELPDGTTPTARTINYTVRPGDAEIKYTAWVQGYRTDTEQTTVMKLRTWEYEFPEFRMYKRLAREYDPVQYSYSIIQTRTNMGAERPIYDWTFPSGASVDQRSATSVIVSAYDPGDYPVSARAYDTRGNEAVLDDTFAVVDPPAVTASLNPLVGDAWSRAPARITTRWYVDGLLSKERVNGITVTLNGDLLSDRVLSSYSFDVTDSGTHNIAIALQTSYGRSATFNTDVTLIDGELPLCTIQTTGNAVTSLRAQASCEIPMGR
ncbi:MAG: Ig-like domain-containing protein, partial [Acidimicrobiia bacterium]|nr:Ig-like domain-containing protein [Acidimicrobiia bacterium]MDX2466627.1 Ig-like domain-containing protein [Acidimicrobiia bacterium]